MHTHRRKLIFKKLPLILCSAFLLSSVAYADGQYGGHESYAEPTVDKGLIESLTGYKYNESTFAKSLGVKFGGWTEIGFAGNPRGGKQNDPVTFNSDANEFNLHQVYGFIEREVDTSSKVLSFGFRADLLYGTDARYTSATNFDTDILNSTGRSKLVFPQAYAEIFMPVGNGITAKVGHFYTIIGYEVVPSTGNFFFSHAYTMQYGEPFTHTGAMLSYPVNDNITLQGGVVSGWDANFKQPANFLGGVTYTTDDERTSLAGSLITGDVRTAGLNVNDDHNRTMYSIVLEHDLTEKLHYVLQHDLGVEESSSFNRSAKWYGINQYLFYDLTQKMAAGLRMEWFRDEDGVRVTGNGLSENYIGVTGGINYKPIQGVTVRPEVRYDVSTNHNVYDGGTDDDQVTLSLSGIFQF